MRGPQLKDFARGRHLRDHCEDAVTALTGLEIGIKKDDFDDPDQDANATHSVKAAANKFAKTATVRGISVPVHHSGFMVWTCGLPITGGQQAV